MSPSKNAKRMLVAIYRLTKGRTDVAVTKDEIFAECRRERLFHLSDDDFKAYHRRVLDEVKAGRS
jgi:hypothetical protein